MDETCANEFIETANVEIPVSIARGFAKYDDTKDKQYADVQTFLAQDMALSYAESAGCAETQRILNQRCNQCTDFGRITEFALSGVVNRFTFSCLQDFPGVSKTGIERRLKI